MRSLNRTIRIAILALAAVLAAAFGSWFLATQGGKPAAFEPPLRVRTVATQSVAPDEAEASAKSGEAVASADPTAQAALLEKIGQTPEYQPFFARLRALYPGDYEAALNAGAGQGMDRAGMPPTFSSMNRCANCARPGA